MAALPCRRARVADRRRRRAPDAGALAVTQLGLWLAAAELAALVLVIAAAPTLEHAATRPDAAAPGLGQSSGD